MAGFRWYSRILIVGNDVLISSYTLDSGVGIMVFAPKNETSVLAARDSSPASPAPGTLQKRLDIQGWSCTTQCGPTDVLGPNNNDCVNLYNGLYAQSGTFSVATGTWGFWDDIYPLRHTIIYYTLSYLCIV